MIIREITNWVYTLKNSYYMEYLKEPTIVVLAPWMVSLLKEECNKLTTFNHIQGGDIDTLFGILVIESPKIKDIKEIEVY